jgi:hypothetical protein
VGRSEWVVPDETGWRVGGHPAWLHTLVGPEATAYVIAPTRGGAVAEAILGLDYGGIMIHDGWSPYELQYQNKKKIGSKQALRSLCSPLRLRCVWQLSISYCLFASHNKLKLISRKILLILLLNYFLIPLNF